MKYPDRHSLNMATSDFAWIYLLIFFIIPLARIIPRLLKRGKMKNFGTSKSFFGDQFDQNSSIPTQEHKIDPSKPQTKDILVLGELIRGTKKFENILKNTDIDGDELESILEDFEKRGLLRVEQKQGLLGTKIELHLTEKGFREYDS